MSTIESLWLSLPHAWERDLREPLATFDLKNGETWGFYAMSLTAWHVLLGVSFIMHIVSGHSKSICQVLTLFTLFSSWPSSGVWGL